MGNDISNDSHLNTQTIVENRQLQDSSTNLSVNGQNIALSSPTKTIDNAKWAYLDSATESQRIGYIFPDIATSVNAYKAEQTGQWSNLSSAYEPGKGTPEVKATYAGLTIPHKINPTDASYTYVILPGASKQETEIKAKKIGAGMNNDIVTINTETIQGVLDKEKELAITNYRASGESRYDNMTTHNYNSTAFTPGSILIRYTTAEEKTITLADPSKSEEKIHFSIPKESYPIISSKSENLTVTSIGNNWDITADTSSKTGESFKITFKKEPPKLTSIAPYTIGLNSYIEGTFSGDITKISIVQNDVEKQAINVADSNFKYYANNLIKNLTDKVFVVGYDSSGKEVDRKKVDIGAKGTIGINGFNLGRDSYVSGTYSGDIAKVMLKVNGIDKQTINVQDGVIKYYAKAMIAQKDDVAELLGYNSAGVLVSTAIVPTGSITMNNYKLGTDSYVTGFFTGNVVKLSLTVNGTQKTTINIPDNPFQYYAKTLITKLSDVVIATAYDMNGNVLAESTVRVVPAPKVTLTDVNATGYIKGKVEGDITTMKLSVNGVIQTSKSLVQEDATFQYYIKSLNLKASDTVALIGLNTDGTELIKTIVQIP